MNIDSRGGLGYIMDRWYIIAPPDGTLLLRRLHDTDDLVKLQKALNHYTANVEEDFNKKVKENTEICGTEKWPAVKPEIIANVRFWDKIFQEDIDILKAFLEKLQ